MFPSSYNLWKIFNTSSFTLALADLRTCNNKWSNQMGCLDKLYSLRISLLMFWRRATLLSANFYTIWGTINSMLTFGTWRISYKIFKAIKATLKLESPSILIKVGTKYFINISLSNYYLDIWNFICNYYTAYKRAFQSRSFLRSSINFLPTICSIFSWRWDATVLIALIGGSIKLVPSRFKLSSRSGFLTYRKFKEYCNYLCWCTPIEDSAFFIDRYLRFFGWGAPSSPSSLIIKGATRVSVLGSASKISLFYKFNELCTFLSLDIGLDTSLYRSFVRSFTLSGSTFFS